MKSIRLILILFLTSLGFSSLDAQTLVGERWVDNSLSIRIEKESIRKMGKLTICIYSTETNVCIENLFTAFETRIVDASGKEIWNALWMGQKKSVVFKKALPEGYKIHITATQPFVINATTGNRIYQDKEISVEYILR
jgi:hypothetical protein